MRTRKKYSGVVVPAVTPLTVDHKLDHAAVEKLFAHFRNNAGLPFILGTTGEASSLPFSLKKEFLELSGKLKQEGDVLYAGVSSNVFVESVALARHAFDHGADIVVATLPSYYALTESAMFRYFEELANAVDGPLMIYNIPSTTHMSIPLELIDRLSHHQNISGLKDSERSEERLTESIQRWSGRTDFSYFLGWAARSARAILEGADGLVPSTGNFHPGLYTDLYAKAIQGEKKEAMKLQELSDALGDLYQKGRTLGESLSALKFIMKESGLCGKAVMPPLYELSSRDEEALREALNEILGKEEINF